MSESPKEPPPDNRHAIRREMRRRRRALSPHEQDRAARQLERLLGRQPLFQRSRHIAFYIANDGEIDPHRVLRSALHRGKRCYLPVLHPTEAGKLWFLPYTPQTPLIANRFGIVEPALHAGRRIPAAALDLVLLPLVAFDRSGARLGMGAGFYDRTFAFKNGTKERAQRRQNPSLLGLAHSCQETARLPVAPWDVPLRAIATESGIVVCDNQASGRDFLQRDVMGSARE